MATNLTTRDPEKKGDEASTIYDSCPKKVCRHRTCPLYKAPPCFYRSVKELVSTRSCVMTNYPDWKQFTRYYNINKAVGEEGVVRYWTYDHPQKDEHTIQSVLDFAEKLGHLPLMHELEELIKAHQQTSPDHECSIDITKCFRQCRKCLSVPSVSSQDKRMQPNQEESLLPTPPYIPLPEEVIHVLAPSLFEEEYPYKLFLGNYWILEPIIALFLVFQFAASIIITLCEDGGSRTVFLDNHINIPEFVHRTMTLFIRWLVRALAPYVFYRQICSMAKAEKALQKKIKKDDYALPPPKPVPYHQHVSLWSIISHAIIFSTLLLYLGAFLTAEDRLQGKRICVKELFRIQVPLIGVRLFVFFDCLSCFFILMLVGLVKDCYCIENRLSTVNDKYFDIIRKRWYRIDSLCYIFPLIIIFFTIVSLSYERPMISTPGHSLVEGDLEMWCFWMIGLTLLQFFGSSSNPMAKIVTVLGDAVALCLASTFFVMLGIDEASFPPGSFVILLYSHLSITTINLLWCLGKTHYRHRGIKSKRFWLFLTYWIVLSLCLIVVVGREVIHLALFVIASS